MGDLSIHIFFVFIVMFILHQLLFLKQCNQKGKWLLIVKWWVLLNELKLPFDVFGDIYVTDDKIYLAILITNESIEITYQFKPIKVNVKSLRLDALIATLASKSREKGQDLLKQGQVSVKFTITNTKTMLIDYGMIISIRKVGRFKIEAIAKKGLTYQVVVNQFI